METVPSNEIKIDTIAKEINVNGKTAHLSRKEFDHLYFIANKNNMISKAATRNPICPK